MQLLNSVLLTIALALLASANPVLLTTRAKVPSAAQVPSANSGFSTYCSNIYEYPDGAGGSIVAYCALGGGVDELQYVSHFKLDGCLTNVNGAIVGRPLGGAMQTCKLGPNGHNLCGFNNCTTADFQFNCQNDDGGVTQSAVNLDDYIGITKDSLGHWVLSCGTDIFGEWTSCIKEGVLDMSCL